MKKRLIVLAVFFVCSAAYAQGGTRHADAPTLDKRYHAIDPHPMPEWYGQGAPHSANDCAPDRAERVWGMNSTLLGYSCETPSANGS